MATVIQKIGLLRGLSTGEYARTGPFVVTVDITRRCNLNCVGCRYHSEECSYSAPGDQGTTDIPLSLFRRLCGELQSLGTAALVISGEGEPFLHPNLPEIVAAAKSKGFETYLFTNGTLLSEEGIRGLVDSGLDTLKVSLWASSAEEYARTHPETDPKNFQRVIAALKLLERIKREKKSALPFVKLHTPICRHNVEGIERMIDLALETGADILSLSPLKTKHDLLDSLSLSPEEEQSLRHNLVRMQKRLKSLPLRHNIETLLFRLDLGKDIWRKTPCYIAWFHARVKVDGLVLPCNPSDLVLGNLHETGFEEIWNNEGFRSFRQASMTQAGLARISEATDCGYCCHALDLFRIHRVYKWLPPFFRGQRRKEH